MLKNASAREGDALVLTKGLGIGVFSAALKKGELSAEDHAGDAAHGNGSIPAWAGEP